MVNEPGRILVHLLSEVVEGHGFQGSSRCWMTSRCGIMTGVEDRRLESAVIGNAEEPLVVEEAFLNLGFTD